MKMVTMTCAAAITMAAVVATSSANPPSRVRRQDVNNPAINTVNGDIVMAVREGSSVRFQVGSETIDATAIPAALRDYTDATVNAIETGFSMGRAQGAAQGQNAADVVRIQTMQEIGALNVSLALQSAAVSTAISTLEHQLQEGLSLMQALRNRTLADIERASTETATRVNNSLDELRFDMRIRGKSSSDPVMTCKYAKAGSGFYWVDPPGNSGEPFQVWCDDRWGGGWMMIVHGESWQYKINWTLANARRAVGGVPSPTRENATGFLQKLSDAQINDYLNLTGRDQKNVMFRLSSNCNGPGNFRQESVSSGWGLFLKSKLSNYDDRYTGMNMNLEARPMYSYGYAPGPLRSPNWWGGPSHSFDTPHDPSHFLGYSDDHTSRVENNCYRFFQGHRGGNPRQDFNCYNPYGGPADGQRCFSLGSSCTCGERTNHPQAWGLQIFAKPFEEYHA